MKTSGSLLLVRHRLGWALTLGSLAVWCSVLIIPWLPMHIEAKTSVGIGALILGELMFWAGLVMLGPELAAKVKAKMRFWKRSD